MQSDIIIVGAGAAGSFAALVAAQMGKTVTVFEKNDFRPQTQNNRQRSLQPDK